MAKAVQEGAVSAGAAVSLKKVTEATIDDLLKCDAVIFGTPNNFGYMAGTLKEFFDQIWLNLSNKAVTKRYGAFSSGQGGAKPALNSIDHVCHEFVDWADFKFEKVTEGVSAKGKPSPEVLEECKQLGRKMAQL